MSSICWVTWCQIQLVLCVSFFCDLKYNLLLGFSWQLPYLWMYLFLICNWTKHSPTRMSVLPPASKIVLLHLISLGLFFLIYWKNHCDITLIDTLVLYSASITVLFTLTLYNIAAVWVYLIYGWHPWWLSLVESESELSFAKLHGSDELFCLLYWVCGFLGFVRKSCFIDGNAALLGIPQNSLLVFSCNVSSI